MDKVSYLIFDCEAIADGELITRVRYPNDALTAPQATRRFRDEVLKERGDGKDILPVTFMLPISVAVAKVDAHYRLLDLSVLDAPQFRPHVITRHFWTGWVKYERPTLVSFNGRGYDLPLLELAAYRYGDRTHRILVNGRTGQVVGSRPYSWVKIALFVLAVVALIIAAVLLFTQLGRAAGARVLAALAGESTCR